MKTSELTGAALDWAVAKCEGWMEDIKGHPWLLYPAEVYEPWEDGTPRTEDELLQRKGYFYATSLDDLGYSTDWSQDGPISEREGISSQKKHDGWWVARIYDINDDPKHYMLSHSRLEAEMRCYVASKLGDEVDVPEELV